jgi:hypothetical protein
MKLGALIREIYDNAGPIYTDVKTPEGGLPLMVQISKSDFVKSLRSRYGNTQAETGFIIQGVGAHRYLDLEPVEAELSPLEQYNLDNPLPFMQYASSNDYEDVSIQELARESMDDSRQSGETERARLICEAAMRRKKGIAEATAYVDRIMPRPAYMMAAKFNYETREFEDQAAA